MLTCGHMIHYDCFDNYIEISAEQNLGIADLLDEIVDDVNISGDSFC